MLAGRFLSRVPESESFPGWDEWLEFGVASGTNASDTLNSTSVTRETNVRLGTGSSPMPQREESLGSPQGALKYNREALTQGGKPGRQLSTQLYCCKGDPRIQKGQEQRELSESFKK